MASAQLDDELITQNLRLVPNTKARFFRTVAVRHSCRLLTVAHPDHSDYNWIPRKIEEIGPLEAKTNLSALLNQVLEGKSFYLTRRGKRIAELRPVAQPSRSRRAGFAKGTFTYIAPDFGAPLDDFANYR